MPPLHLLSLLWEGTTPLPSSPLRPSILSSVKWYTKYVIAHLSESGLDTELDLGPTARDPSCQAIIGLVFKCIYFQTDKSRVQKKFNCVAGRETSMKSEQKIPCLGTCHLLSVPAHWAKHFQMFQRFRQSVFPPKRSTLSLVLSCTCSTALVHLSPEHSSQIRSRICWMKRKFDL